MLHRDLEYRTLTINLDSGSIQFKWVLFNTRSNLSFLPLSTSGWKTNFILPILKSLNDLQHKTYLHCLSDSGCFVFDVFEPWHTLSFNCTKYCRCLLHCLILSFINTTQPITVAQKSVRKTCQNVLCTKVILFPRLLSSVHVKKFRLETKMKLHYCTSRRHTWSFLRDIDGDRFDIAGDRSSSLSDNSACNWPKKAVRRTRVNGSRKRQPDSSQNSKNIRKGVKKSVNLCS